MDTGKLAFDMTSKSINKTDSYCKYGLEKYSYVQKTYIAAYLISMMCMKTIHCMSPDSL